MLGKISMVLFVHCIFSTLRWRTYLQANQEPFFLPMDITLEIAIATLMAITAILSLTSKLKPIKQFTQYTSYDASFYRPNFVNRRASRATMLLPYLKERLATQDFALQLRL